MRILLACEESQTVCKELRKLGHEAFSCDLLPCSGGHPEWHLQQDVTELLKQKWDMIIAFPPCTYLTVTGNRWFNIERYGEQAIQSKGKDNLQNSNSKRKRKDLSVTITQQQGSMYFKSG